MGTERQLGYATVGILQSITRGHRYGFDIMADTGLAGGTVFATLGRLQKRGIVRARWEDARIAAREGRPRRRYYQLTGSGEKALARSLERFRQLAIDVGADPPDPTAGKA